LYSTGDVVDKSKAVESRQAAKTRDAGQVEGSRRVETLVLGLFIGSGAAGLIYQVVWSRELVLVFGNTSQAISTIVTAFMIGLGLGGYVGGRLAGRSSNPLRLYSFLELMIAVLALALPLGFGMIGDAYKAAYGSLGPTELGLVRFALALIAITPVTFLMGMTLPVLTRYMVTRIEQAGPQIAQLYAANTLGAVLGTIVSGFLLIELLGLTGTTYVAVFLNTLAGVGAFLLSRSPGAVIASDRTEAEAAAKDQPASALIPFRRNVVFLATFVSGFVALALEVLWTRMLAEGTGSRIYIFVMILAIYLLGIALGSGIYKRYSSPSRDTLSTLGICFAGIGLFAVVTVVLGSGVLGVLPQTAGYLMILPATLIMGYAFPLSGRLVTPTTDEAAGSVGLLYFWNTAGSILGSFAAAFLLAGTIGTNSSVLILSALSLLVGALLTGMDRRVRVPNRGLLIGGIAALAVVSLAAMALRVPVTRTVTENVLRSQGVPTTHLEDSIATVDSVGGEPGQRRLLVGGVGMTKLTIDTKLMAYLPRALRPDARSYLVIAFGMGTTYRSGLILGMQTDVVELSPSVPTQFPVYYPDAQRFLDHPEGRVIVGDGRNYVRLSDKKYDLIAVDPAPPIQSAGTVVLYTREFLEQGKQRLNPGGIFMLWVPYDETLGDFKDHLRTFRASFPHMQVLFGPGYQGVYMLGSEEPLKFDDGVIENLFGTEGAQADLADAPDYHPVSGADWPEVVRSLVWIENEEVDSFVGPGPLITDDRPRTEYYLLRNLFAADKRYVHDQLLRELTPGGR